MEFTGVYHKTSEQMSYPLDEDRLIVNIKTGYDVKQVFIHYGDPYEAGILGGNEKWTGKREEIIYKKRLPHQIWWTTTLFPAYKRCKYYFELRTEKEVWYYFEDGFLTEEQLQMEGRIQQCFIVPWMNPADINRTPAWVNDTIWYQIFPERFCNGNPKLSPENVAPWGTAPDRQIFMGGDLPGITQKLSYLEELGVNALYLTPIFEATSNHKYDTVDYTRIDPHFGDESDLVELINQAHKRGIRVILDGVFNHCGGGFRQFQDVVEHGEESPFRDWFYIREFPVSFDPLNFDSFGDTPYTPRHPGLKNLSEEQLRTACMPKWNTENPQAKEYLLGAVAKWTRMGIDGWRLDVATEVDSHFWREFRETVRGINPDALIIGEFWRNSEAWLQGDQYDGVMNYGVQRAAVEYFAKSAVAPQRFQELLTENLMRYSDAANDSMLNLLDSHDTARFLTVSGGNTARLKNAAAFLFTFVGMPCTYYGTEIGMTGENDPDCRKAFDWEESHWNTDLRTHYQKLMRLRKTRKALQEGTVRFRSQGDLFVMERQLQEE